MQPQPVLEMLKKTKAILTQSHFVYTSGKHGDVYVNKDALYPHVTQAAQVGLLFANTYADKQIETVVGPALGGIILSQWTAYQLSMLTHTQVFGVYTEKTTEGGMHFTRGYERFVSGKRVLIVEDLTTTGGSVAKVVQAVKAAGGDIVEVCVMVNRNPGQVSAESVGAPFRSLATLPTQVFEASACPLCAAHIPINTTVGHGKKFLAAQAAA